MMLVFLLSSFHCLHGQVFPWCNEVTVPISLHDGPYSRPSPLSFPPQFPDFPSSPSVHGFELVSSD